MNCPACQTPVESSQKFCPKCGGMLPGESEATADPFVGKVIANKYRIAKLLGEGGMGCVYVGEQQMGTTVRKVAVKTLHKHLSTDPQIKARFTREVGTIAQLEHPNTIQVFDFGTTDDGTLYIVMELVQGKSVQETLEKEGPLDPARVENIMRQVTGSLEEAHGLGIIHRDLKPDNVVLCERAGQKDWVEVLDFGIAKRSNETDEKEAKLTQQGMVLGTPPYMSPEQFTGQPLDARSDIYSLGVMAYEMLTGQLPFEANTAWEWATQHMTAQPKAFEATPNGALLPPKMRNAIMRALSKKADDRFKNVKEFFEAFSTGAGGPVSASTDAQPMSMSGGQMGGAPMNTGPMGGAPMNAGPMNAGPMSGGPAGGGPVRAKTEVGTPVFGGDAMGGASPYGAPPSPMGAPMGSPMGAPSGSYGAPIPAAPPRETGGGGGNRGMLIGIAGAVAVLTIGGVIASIALSGKKTVVVAADPTATTPTTTDVATTTSATPDPTSSAEDTTKPLGPTHPNYVAPTHPAAAHDAGHAVAPTTPSAVPTPPKPPGGNAALPPAVQAACTTAAAARAKGIPNPSAEKTCRDGHGTM